MNLRYIEREGKLVLQYDNTYGFIQSNYEKWHDVPIHKESEPQNAILKHVIAGQEANLKWIEKKIAENIIPQPETPKKPREFWLDPFYLHGSPFSARALPTGCVGEIYVTEVPKGYKLISRDEAFNAIDAMWIYHRNLNYDEKMKACLKELGFGE